MFTIFLPFLSLVCIGHFFFFFCFDCRCSCCCCRFCNSYSSKLNEKNFRWYFSYLDVINALWHKNDIERRRDAIHRPQTEQQLCFRIKEIVMDIKKTYLLFFCLFGLFLCYPSLSLVLLFSLPLSFSVGRMA